ncbi:YraN family protein [Niabella hibiscisoli]|uniref:YraN family protein n=1 Tax=Niabella hibiscisoli TaxID=1825928 RepID=UPI001F0E7B15|nr:YraN family protein [Niabella hibiscisoli]MCH5717484.1 YraN family protein [Niabella hibiscisoli]
MAIHNDIGKNGESLAATYLQSKGYTIVCKNWRHSYYEIDIIANKGKKLHFIEVKTRSSEVYGHPEDSVTKKSSGFLKMRLMNISI